MLLISKDKAKFSLLSESAFQKCNSYHFQFCNPETAFYQTNTNTFCVIALFMQNVHDIKHYCKQVVVLNESLPITKYLSFGVWFVVTNRPLTFTLNCQVHEPKINDFKIVPPFGIIRLNNTCKASNRYLQLLPVYYGKYSNFERSDPFQALLKVHNVSQFSIWNEAKSEIGYKAIKLPPQLIGLKEIPVQSLLSETRTFRPIILDQNKHSNCHDNHAVLHRLWYYL